MSVHLASQKQMVITGGDVNYYLVVIKNLTGGDDTVVEVEDIIEHFGMSFCLGTIFKSLVRYYKLRQNLGKLGSSSLYEAQKILYYASRAKAMTECRAQRMSLFSWIYQKMRVVTNRQSVFDFIPSPIVIRNPKRLNPYQFDLVDFCAALHMKRNELHLMEELIAIAAMHCRSRVSFPQEKLSSSMLVHYATQLEQQEKALVKVEVISG